MSSDYHSPEKVNARRRARYIREHAHHALAAVAPAAVLPGGPLTVAEVARCAVEQTAALYDALPPDPDQEQGSGAPAELLPVEPEATARAVLPACTCTGKQPCSAECRRCVPERRQSAGPDEATHAGRVRVRSASGILALGAACRQTCDPAVRALAHAAAVQAGARRCDACGERLDVQP